jgi:radical SAM/Cys-rich protein
MMTRVAENFEQMVKQVEPGLLKLKELRTLQVNLGNRCNQSCAHCHVQAGPEGEKVMSRAVMARVLGFLQNHKGLTVDMTGGCPELNPDFRFFVEEVHRLADRLMVRTNFTVFFEPELEWVPKWYSEHDVVLIGSLPCYTQDNVTNQRGSGVFDKSIKALQILNELGYGCDQGLELDLVYNPGGDFLPGPQEKLESDYKKELGEKYGISFDRLFTITNAPIGRFRQYLKSNGQLEQYQQLLFEGFNSAAAQNIMCRSLVSVDYRGIVYNCDFNQALGLPIVDADGVVSIEQLEQALRGDIEIATGDHCFCCTAGSGSSCTGSLVE